MLSRMVPSLPPEMRTFHLLKTADILCANDSRLLFSYHFVTDDLPTIHSEPRNSTAFWHLNERFALSSGIDRAGLPVQLTGKPAKCIIRSGHAELGTQESGAGLVQSFGTGGRAASEWPLVCHRATFSDRLSGRGPLPFQHVCVLCRNLPFWGQRRVCSLYMNHDKELNGFLTRFQRQAELFFQGPLPEREGSFTRIQAHR